MTKRPSVTEYQRGYDEAIRLLRERGHAMTHAVSATPAERVAVFRAADYLQALSDANDPEPPRDPRRDGCVHDPGWACAACLEARQDNPSS